MDLRKMKLPPGWYPKGEKEAVSRLSEWNVSSGRESGAVAAVVPHAGWTYSGKMAWEMISRIPEDTEIVIVAGGHLYAGAPSLVLDYSALETPFGNLKVDRELIAALCADFEQDETADNTVEIQLPMIKYSLPQVSVLPVRLPPDNSSIRWGKSAAAVLKGRKVFFLGSTDLSHYGLRFGYNDFGFGRAAREKIRLIDRDFLEALKSFDLTRALNMAGEDRCACSAGAAAAAASFAEEYGSEGTIVSHHYSYDIFDGDQDFVGYGTLLYCR